MRIHLFHRWILKRDTGFTRYYECGFCKKRYIAQGCGGYQPIDWEWISLNKKE